ncbi:PorP/SprF family type IX secretion system membrane protein [Pedobacter namyangjuensis]|uniref:PorP/SprF family type IX secretion system membrane protein n=1 Tax=Pedobacter namyangjuensis TaxID=600626 RepID=UPI000DE42C74|nr:PorP/SprF family type IX secretion system membrane protein [Pedobacter namyangjuensis]
MKTLKYIISAVCILLIGDKAIAQLNPMGSAYYQNQYLMNPAMAGIEKGWELNGAYKAQWTSIDGAPNMQALTATYGSEGKKAGFGMLLLNDKAGSVKTLNIKGTFAYHLELNNEKTKIDFGLSAGVMDEFIDRSEVIGDLTDVAIGNFNERKLYLDADFGVALRTENLTLQGALPNMKRFLKRDVERNLVDRSLYMAAISYKFLNQEAKLTSIEPKVAYRSIENYKDIIDAGVNFQFNGDKLMLSGVYHSTNSVTFGAGTTYMKKLAILAQYTTNTSDLQRYSNGEFELAVKYNFR